MIKKRVKEMGKDVMTLGITGMGLGVMGSVGGAPAIGVLGKGLGRVGGIVMVGHGMKILSEVVPKKRKGGF